jgi:hypothetical protein
MNDGNSSREKAEEAYDYAFTVNRSAPQWYRFRWNTLHALLTNGVARFALVIPIIRISPSAPRTFLRRSPLVIVRPFNTQNGW